MSGKDKKKTNKEIKEEKEFTEEEVPGQAEETDEAEVGELENVGVESGLNDQVLETGPAEIVDEEDAGEDAGSGEEEVKDEEGGWEKEKEELLDRIKRKQAEMDNLRRISKKEQSEAREYALQDFLSKLLPVLDNIERGLETARTDEDVPDSYTDGLEMIYKQLFQVLEQEGVCLVEAENKPFDPYCHHAVMEVESEEVDPGNVAEVLQKGYWHRDRVLRPAMVKVCRE